MWNPATSNDCFQESVSWNQQSLLKNNRYRNYHVMHANGLYPHQLMDVLWCNQSLIHECCRILPIRKTLFAAALYVCPKSTRIMVDTSYSHDYKWLWYSASTRWSVDDHALSNISHTTTIAMFMFFLLQRSHICQLILPTVDLCIRETPHSRVLEDVFSITQ